MWGNYNRYVIGSRHRYREKPFALLAAAVFHIVSSFDSFSRDSGLFSYLAVIIFFLSFFAVFYFQFR